MDEKLKLYRQLKLLVMNIPYKGPKLKDIEIFWDDDGRVLGYKIEVKVDDKPKLKLIKDDDD